MVAFYRALACAKNSMLYRDEGGPFYAVSPFAEIPKVLC
ncbi:hypothetical protein CEB3_c02940 [Peptococcaceae bacterium CEB3]|nr:hypothetical protein CEB3_c02940 [Peptococcaceae bacterium CEB3]